MEDPDRKYTARKKRPREILEREASRISRGHFLRFSFKLRKTEAAKEGLPVVKEVEGFLALSSYCFQTQLRSGSADSKTLK